MEFTTNRNGLDRVLEKIGQNKIRVMGESLFTRTATDENGNITMFDFEGGPAFNVGGKVQYMKSFWKIEGIQPEQTDQENLVSVLLTVKLEY